MYSNVCNLTLVNVIEMHSNTLVTSHTQSQDAIFSFFMQTFILRFFFFWIIYYCKTDQIYDCYICIICWNLYIHLGAQNQFHDDIVSHSLYHKIDLGTNCWCITCSWMILIKVYKQFHFVKAWIQTPDLILTDHLRKKYTLYGAGISSVFDTVPFCVIERSVKSMADIVSCADI